MVVGLGHCESMYTLTAGMEATPKCPLPRDMTQRPGIRTAVLAILLATFLSTSPASAFDGSALCYLVADNTGNNTDFLSSLDGAQEQFIGQTGTTYVEAVSFDPNSGVLYAADSGRFGSLDLSTGDFTEIGLFGSGEGSLGTQLFGDVDGLAFDPFSGILYASVRRQEEDLLIQVNAQTGVAVENAFGYGVTYLVIDPFVAGYVQLDDIDDIAIDPKDGRMFGIVNEDGVSSRLISIDKNSGAISDLTDLDVENVEGLGFSADGALLGVLGDLDREVVVIDQQTGETTTRATLGTNYGTDYEGIACMTDDSNEVTGRVFEDVNENGVFDGYDDGFEGATIQLYRDLNANGQVEASDALLDQTTSDGYGNYSFVISALGDFLVSVDQSSLPGYSTLTTTGVHQVWFGAFGETDTGNDFGFTPGAPASNPALCYVVADNDLNGGSEDVLTKLPGYGSEVIIGDTGTIHVEAIAYRPSTNTLFAADADRLGELDLNSGAFSEIGQFGGGEGADGWQDFSDIDGLALDPFSGILFASVRRENQPDLLIQVDADTGGAIEDAFGSGQTYVVFETITVDYIDLDDIDDIAIDTYDGKLYGILNHDGMKSRLVLIDKWDGGTTDLTDLDIENVEGLGFSANGTLLGVAGDTDRQVVVIDANTGVTTLRASLGAAGNTDYEGIACLTDAANKISGTVFSDTNENGQLDYNETGQGYVTVSLFRDTNENGEVDFYDRFVASLQTAGDGTYEFTVSSLGDFVLETDLGTYPANTDLTTDNVETASFTRFGESDTGNDFGFTEARPRIIDLELTKEVDSSSPRIGETVTFTITVVNAGPDNATGIVVRDIIPYGLEFEGAWTSQGDYDFMTGYWTIGSLAAGENATMDISAKVSINNTIENIAQVTSANETDVDSTPDNGVPTEDDQDNALVTARASAAFTPSDCTDMGTITALVYDPLSDLLYAGTETGSVHISDDFGKSWPPFLQTDNRTPIRDIVISNTGVVYVATAGAGVFVSDTEGERWNNIGPNQAVFSDIDLLDNRSQAYAAGDGSVQFWDGMAWSVAGTNSNPFANKMVRAVAVDDATGLVFAAAAGLGVYALVDGWWKPMGAGLPVGVINALHAVDGEVYAGTNTDGIYRLEGGLWKSFGAGLEGQAIETISNGPDGQLLTGTRERGAFYFDANAGLWVEAVNLPVYTVSAVTAGSDGVIYAGTPGSGVYAFIDSDSNGSLDQWRHVAAIVANAVIQDIVKTETGELFAATYGYGVLYSNDGGQCWTRMNRGFENLYTYAIERNSAGTLFVGIWADGKGGVWRSDDNARSWQYLDLGNRQVLSIAIDPNDEDVMYAGVNLEWGSIYRSVDGGYTWEQLNSFGDPAWSIQVDPNDSNHVVVGTIGAGVWESFDKGASFAKISAHYGVPSGAFDLHFGPRNGPYDGWLFAATPEGVYVNRTGALELFGQGSDQYDVRTLAFMGDTIFGGTWGDGVIAYNAQTDQWEDAGFGALPVLAFAVMDNNNTLIVGTSGSGLYIGRGLAFSTSTDVEDLNPSTDIPTSFSLDSAYPNPFNPRTTIPFSMPEAGDVRLAVYDLLGREVAVLVDATLSAGSHQVSFDAGQVPSGTYLVRLSAGGTVESMTVTLVK
jgi:uncharacterized repeat protein (TIGR01451 family)